MLASEPLSLTPFIGRTDEVDALVTLVGTTRLVTLTGAGGSGKTRLAGEVARRVQTRFADGVVWVELAPLADRELLPTYLLDALAIEPGARRPENTILDSLSGDQRTPAWSADGRFIAVTGTPTAGSGVQEIHTPYVRAGRGDAMVIVAADVDARDVQQMIVDLAERFLVLAAAPGIEGGREFERWLRNFLDGLGVSAAHVVFHASVSPALITGDD